MSYIDLVIWPAIVRLWRLLRPSRTVRGHVHVNPGRARITVASSRRPREVWSRFVPCTGPGAASLAVTHAPGEFVLTVDCPACGVVHWVALT